VTTALVGLHGPTDLTGPVGLNRTYFQWADDAKEDAQIKKDLAAGRTPWVSFKPPTGGVAAILAGKHDAQIKAKGRRYAKYNGRVLTTFFHEPVGDVRPDDFNKAFLRINRLMGFTNRTVFTPILNGYLWADWYNGSKGAVNSWVSASLVRTCPFFGADHYGEPHEIQRMLNYLSARGVRSVGLGEFGRDQGPEVFQQKLDLFEANEDFLTVVAYYNSRIQTFGDESSPLGPGTRELEMFRAYLGR